MRDERLRLADIMEAADAIARFVSGRTEAEFVNDSMLCSAVLYQLGIIGEAATNLPIDFRNRHPEIPWPQIVRFRNFIVHAYFAVNWSIVWVAATKNAPELRAQVAAILASEFP
jgi:uncharacterized protein with HEPN domain